MLDNKKGDKIINRSKHTPGKWTKTSNIIEDDGGSEIARVTYDQTGHVQANARLIAAAPELLEMLKKAQSYVETVSNATHYDVENDHADYDLLAEIESVINQAEGGEKCL